MYKNKLIISGGLKDFAKCDVNDEIIIYDPNQRSHAKAVKYLKLGKNYFPRFSHSSHVLNDGRLVLVGGVVTTNMEFLVSVVDLVTLQVTNFVTNCSLHAPLVQHASAQEGKEILVFGGGTNCFSFGMHVNKEILRINLLNL